MTDHKDLKKLIKLLKSEGVTEFKDGDLELKLQPSTPKFRRVRGEKPVETPQGKPEPTPEDLLFWSSDPAIAAKYSGDEDAKDS